MKTEHILLWVIGAVLVYEFILKPAMNSSAGNSLNTVAQGGATYYGTDPTIGSTIDNGIGIIGDLSGGF
jgi:hypothetical protein